MDAADTGRVPARPGRDEQSTVVMIDVARLAGVSHMTVSRVINEPWRVRAATRHRVQSAIDSLNYRPNPAARSLKTRKSRTIGVVALNTTLFGPASTLPGIERAAREAGYFVSVASAEHISTDALRASVHHLMDQPVDGLVVIAPLRSAGQALDALDESVPAVTVEGIELGATSCVAVDQRLGARLAVEHLLALGHRTVHHISGPLDWREAEARVDGWRTALKSARRRVPAISVGDWGARSGYQAALAITERPGVTALFVANDHMALGALHALHERGIRVPQDVSVVGFDDVPECTHYLPALTTVRQDFTEVGRQSLQMLVGHIEGTPPPETTRFITPELVIRASTAPSP